MRTQLKRHLLSLINEALMLEYQVASGVRLYHRSTKAFKVGDVLTSQKNDKGQHWLSYHLHEKGLEEFRTKRHYAPPQKFTARERKKKSFVEPERTFKSLEHLPSRFECVYATFVPHSRFLSKGQLYVVEPIGATHVVDSRIIDKLARLPVRYRSVVDDDDDDTGHFEDDWEARRLYEDYWEGTEPNRANLKNLEILMDSARIVEVVDEITQPIQQGNNFIVSGGPVIIGKLEMRGGDRVSWGENTQTFEDFIVDAANIPGLEIGKKPQESYFSSVTVKLTQGFKGKIHTMRLPEPGNTEQDPFGPRLEITPSDLKYPVNIQLMDGLMFNFMKSIRKGFIKKI